MSEITKNELEADLGGEIYTDPICTSVSEVVRSNIGKRIFRIILEKGHTYARAGSVDNVSDLIERLFDPQKQLSLDDAIYLIEEMNLKTSVQLNTINGKEHQYNWWKKKSVAKDIFSKIIIQGRAKHNLNDHIGKLGGVNANGDYTYKNYEDEILKSIYANFLDRPNELAQLPGSEKYTNIGGTLYIGKEESFTVIDDIPYTEEFSSDKVEADVLISKEFGISVIILNKGEDEEQQLNIPHLVGKVIDRTGNSLVLELKDGKYLIYNHKDGEVIYENLTNISRVVENKIFIQELDASYKLVDLTSNTIIKQFSNTQFSNSNYLEQVKLPKDIDGEVGLYGFPVVDGYFKFETYKGAPHLYVGIGYIEITKKIMRKDKKVRRSPFHRINLSQVS